MRSSLRAGCVCRQIQWNVDFPLFWNRWVNFFLSVELSEPRIDIGTIKRWQVFWAEFEYRNEILKFEQFWKMFIFFIKSVFKPMGDALQVFKQIQMSEIWLKIAVTLRKQACIMMIIRLSSSIACAFKNLCLLLLRQNHNNRVTKIREFRVHALELSEQCVCRQIQWKRWFSTF